MRLRSESGTSLSEPRIVRPAKAVDGANPQSVRGAAGVREYGWVAGDGDTTRAPAPAAAAYDVPYATGGPGAAVYDVFPTSAAPLDENGYVAE